MSYSSSAQQLVCTACGFNMIGFHPKRCRFCGATPDRFISAEECSAKHSVKETRVTEKVSQLKSFPQLGYEHAAYKIKTDDAVIWIDCPSSFDISVAPMNYILFTHNDFLGASNLYRKEFGTQVWIHQKDAAHPNSRFFTFDRRFETNFHLSGIEAFVIGGHSPGFTLYFFEDILFICDYVDRTGDRFFWNPYGNKWKTKTVGQTLPQILEKRTINTVCDVGQVWNYQTWKPKLDELVKQEAQSQKP